jgi:hypothetical protein
MVLLGWILVFAMALLSETPERGAGKVFALYFGWAYAIVWFSPWVLAYGVMQFFRRRHASRGA